jgi:hypothetical protein
MKIIYVVTSGAYSDYSINAVYDSRELAEAAARGREGYAIEEYPLNPGEAEWRAGRSLWHVQIRADGSVISADDFGMMWDADGLPDNLTIETTQALPIPDQPWVSEIVGFVLDVYVWSEDQTRATKVANERRAEWIASGKWQRRSLELRNTFSGKQWVWNEREAS